MRCAIEEVDDGRIKAGLNHQAGSYIRGRFWRLWSLLCGRCWRRLLYLRLLHRLCLLCGLINSVPGLALVYGLVNIPVAFWLLALFLRQVPAEVEEAAALDGAGPLRILVWIVCPMIALGIVATYLILVFLGYGEFLFSSAFSLSDATRTLTVGLSLFQCEHTLGLPGYCAEGPRREMAIEKAT